MNLYRSWATRHTHPVSLALHCLGIPLTVAALPLLVAGQFSRAVIAFAAGYTLQFLGHALEGNKSGEQLLLERLLGRRGQ